MRILHIITQKPFATGSGVYLSGLIKAITELGHDQFLICGIDKDEADELKKVVTIPSDPVLYRQDVPFLPVGMSDVMPYPNTRYSDLTEVMTQELLQVFEGKIRKALAEFKPDLVICAHLYLVTALTANILAELRGAVALPNPGGALAKSPYLIGICHGSDLRQFQSNPRLQPYVKAAIPLLDRIVTSHLEQKNEITALFDVEEAKILVCGSGFNDRIFNTSGRVHPDNSVVKIVYTGKLSSAKGVFELLAALKTLQTRYSLDLTLIGSSSSEAELSRLDEAIGELAFPVHTTGIIPQAQIAEIYQQSHLFVLPSYYEGMPLTVPEALATGLRVVVTRLPGFEDWLKDFPDSVSLVDPPDMATIDAPSEAGRADFIHDLALALAEQIERTGQAVANDLSHMTWVALAQRILQA